MAYFQEIKFLLGRDKSRLPWIILLFLFSSFLDMLGIGIIFPFVSLILSEGESNATFFYEIFGFLGLEQNYETFLVSTVIFLSAIFLFKAILSICVQWVIIRFSNQVMFRHRITLMHAFQNMDYEDYLGRNSAEYVYAINNLASLFSSKVLIVGLKAISDIIITIAVVSVLLWINPLDLMVLFLVLASAFWVYDRFFRKKIKEYGEEANVSSEVMLQGLNEGIHGYKEIKILGKENVFYQMVRSGARKYASSMTNYSTLSHVPRYLFEFVIILFVLLLILKEFYLVSNFSALIPSLATFGLASMRLLPAGNSISSAITSLRFNRHTVSRLYSNLKNLKDTKDLDPEANQTSCSDFINLELTDVSYRYPSSSKDALDSISLKINNGESIGIVGESGSGKTTLIDLLLGLLNPQSGTVTFNGQPIQDVLDQWRLHIAYLPQEIFITDNNLRNNITLEDSLNTRNDDLIQSVLKATNLNEVVDDLPDGLQTNLGERGVRLSGGQRQRVALARALFHNRDILILDESTSSLDSKTESEIIAEIKKLKGEKTLIIIAHRHSTLRFCDKIYHLNNGRIVKVGDFNDLVEVTA